MARPLRIEYPNALYHVTSRGNARGDIFHCDEDREEFLFTLNNVVKRFNWLCHAYCLMDNHYHLLIETPEGNLSQGMRQLNGVYTQKYNYRHSKVGHVFQGRYKSILVDKENYLLELSRYVVLNPVRANMVSLPEEWKWSSYRYTAGINKVPEYLKTEWILGHFSRKKTEAQKLYRRFVKEGIASGSPWQELQGQILLGEKNFIEKYRKLLHEKEQIKEIPRIQRYLDRPKLADLFSEVYDKQERDKNIYLAHVKYGYRLNEISRYLGIHYTTASKVIKNVEKN